jgi:protein scribble
VLSVNGHSVVNVDHYDAVEVLKRSGYKLVLVVTREVPRLVPVTTKVCHSDSLTSTTADMPNPFISCFKQISN